MFRQNRNSWPSICADLDRLYPSSTEPTPRKNKTIRQEPLGFNTRSDRCVLSWTASLANKHSSEHRRVRRSAVFRLRAGFSVEAFL